MQNNMFRKTDMLDDTQDENDKQIRGLLSQQGVDSAVAQRFMGIIRADSQTKMGKEDGNEGLLSRSQSVCSSIASDKSRTSDVRRTNTFEKFNESSGDECYEKEMLEYDDGQYLNMEPESLSPTETNEEREFFATNRRSVSVIVEQKSDTTKNNITMQPQRKLRGVGQPLSPISESTSCEEVSPMTPNGTRKENEQGGKNAIVDNVNNYVDKSVRRQHSVTLNANQTAMLDHAVNILSDEDINQLALRAPKDRQSDNPMFVSYGDANMPDVNKRSIFYTILPDNFDKVAFDNVMYPAYKELWDRDPFLRKWELVLVKCLRRAVGDHGLFMMDYNTRRLKTCLTEFKDIKATFNPSELIQFVKDIYELTLISIPYTFWPFLSMIMNHDSSIQMMVKNWVRVAIQMPNFADLVRLQLRANKQQIEEILVTNLLFLNVKDTQHYVKLMNVTDSYYELLTKQVPWTLSHIRSHKRKIVIRIEPNLLPLDYFVDTSGNDDIDSQERSVSDNKVQLLVKQYSNLTSDDKKLFVRLISDDGFNNNTESSYANIVKNNNNQKKDIIATKPVQTSMIMQDDSRVIQKFQNVNPFKIMSESLKLTPEAEDKKKKEEEKFARIRRNTVRMRIGFAVFKERRDDVPQSVNPYYGVPTSEILPHRFKNLERIVGDNKFKKANTKDVRVYLVENWLKKKEMHGSHIKFKHLERKDCEAVLTLKGDWWIMFGDMLFSSIGNCPITEDNSNKLAKLLYWMPDNVKQEFGIKIRYIQKKEETSKVSAQNNKKETVAEQQIKIKLSDSKSVKINNDSDKLIKDLKECAELYEAGTYNKENFARAFVNINRELCASILKSIKSGTYKPSDMRLYPLHTPEGYKGPEFRNLPTEEEFNKYLTLPEIARQFITPKAFCIINDPAVCDSDKDKLTTLFLEIEKYHKI